ncbi:HBL140Wp [Eremothecium sinecaudum]|uniref:HBL140Wp n=1 Tax=Eremothecium sinecaudum TaxID=45286 RepID=A0A109UWS6_9SACH|nr:HBL140Wp [Eremothecium sinecaudum]AMD18762.1 HBL140Wp [Eremothecium sinecaudum]
MLRHIFCSPVRLSPLRATIPLLSYSPRLPRTLGLRAQSNVAATKNFDEQFIVPKEIVNEAPGVRINITDRAAKRLGEIYKTKQNILRIVVESGGCHGFQYLLKLEPYDQNKTVENVNPQAEEDDDFDDFETVKDVIYVLPENNGMVVIDQKSQRILNNTTLTYTKELIGSMFKVVGGNLKSSCGCGSSFTLDN